MRTGSPSASPATSPGGPRSSCSTTATTARWTKRSSPSTTVCRARARQRRPAGRPDLTTHVIECNDLEALERALEPGDVACVLAEPALTNIGIVLPETGYHDGAAPAHPRDRHAARHRRDAHHLRRPRWLHPGVGPRAGHGDARQADRQRGARGRLRIRPGDRRPRPQRTGTTTPPTSAASAAPWPATRSASRRCARRSARCSPTRPTSA